MASRDFYPGFPIPNPNSKCPARNARYHNPTYTSTDAISRQGQDKMFSPIEPVIYEQILIIQWAISRNRTNAKFRVKKANDQPAAIPQIVPELKEIIRTLEPTESNVGTGTILYDNDVFYSWNPGTGIARPTADAAVELICDYANRWHSAKPSGKSFQPSPNRHLPGTPSMFAYLPCSFERVMGLGPQSAARDLATRFTVDEFWQLRYLFALVMGNSDAPGISTHIGVCVISPEAKTIEYLCSAGDSGLAADNRSQCLETFVVLLNHFLHSAPPSQRFNPREWKIRTGASLLQDRNAPDCGIYTVSNVMSLAFGWNVKWGPRNEEELKRRRHRMVADLTFRGYGGWNTEKGGANTQYYPLVDTKPTNGVEEGFGELLTYPRFMSREALQLFR